MNNQRNQYLDIIKACACVMVVYLHSSNLFRYAQTSNLVPALSRLSQCGVPIFFAVSGYLSVSLRDRSYFETMKKKLKSLIIPFIIWNFIYLLFEIIGHCIMPAAFEDITGCTLKEYILNLFGIPFIQPPIYGPLWFVRELVVLFALYPIIVLCVKHLPIFVLGFCLLLLQLGNMPMLYENGYFLKNSLPFFVLGLWSGFNQNNERNEKFTKFCVKKEVVAGTALIAIVLSYMNKLYYDNNIVQSFLYFLSIFMFFPLIFYYGEFVDKTNGRLLKLFLIISEFSFMIFVLHGKILTIIQIVCTRIITQNSAILLAEYIIMPIVVITIVIFISLILSKKVSGIYLFFTGGR